MVGDTNGTDIDVQQPAVARPTDIAALAKLARRSNSPSVRRESRQRIIDCGPEGVEALTGAYARAAAGRKRGERIVSPILACLIPVQAIIFYHQRYRDGFHLWGHLVERFLPLLTPFIITSPPSSRERDPVNALALLRDRRAIAGFLGASAFIGPSMERKLIVDALVEILPTLTEEDGGRLDEAQRTRLYAMASGKAGIPDIRLARAALLAIQKIGDEKAIPALELAAQREAKSRALPELRELGEETLALVRERADRSAASATLPRPSAETEARSHETLLRAIEQSPETHVEQLLRPAGEA